MGTRWSMDNDAIDPHDDSVRSVPLPSDDEEAADEVITQQNQSAEVTLGGGEWPSPDVLPSGPAPGRTEDATEPAATAHGHGPERTSNAGSDAEFRAIKEVLEEDPDAGGTQTLPIDDDEEVDDIWTRDQPT